MRPVPAISILVAAASSLLAAEQDDPRFAQWMENSRTAFANNHLIAYVLGLSHAVNIAFFTALIHCSDTAPRLLELSSTTFDSQFEVARRVAQESPELYFEIRKGALPLDPMKWRRRLVLFECSRT